jgi:hypothetical protein
LDQPEHAAKDTWKIQRYGLERLAAGEGEKALDQQAGPLGRLKSALDHPLLSLVAPFSSLKQVEATDNRCQQIIEVVSDTPGQLAHAFQLLALTEGLLCPLQLQLSDLVLGDVAGDSIDPAILRNGSPLQPAPTPILVSVPILEAAKDLALGQPIRRVLGALPVFGMLEIAEVEPLDFDGIEAQDGSACRTDASSRPSKFQMVSRSWLSCQVRSRSSVLSATSDSRFEASRSSMTWAVFCS